ncbi:MAG: DUF1097 family protein [Pseudolabrys sp.]
MSQTTALSISIAVLGAIWAYLALGPFSSFTLVWAGFIAWGCFFHTGGDNSALAKTIVGYTLSKGATGALTASSAANPFVLMIVSLIIGALFGFVSGKLAGLLQGSGGVKAKQA